jgi:hypothetical protein
LEDDLHPAAQLALLLRTAIGEFRTVKPDLTSGRLLPDSPTIASVSPRAMVRSTPSTAFTVFRFWIRGMALPIGKCFFTPRSSSRFADAPVVARFSLT